MAERETDVNKGEYGLSVDLWPFLRACLGEGLLPRRMGYGKNKIEVKPEESEKQAEVVEENIPAEAVEDEMGDWIRSRP